MESHAAAVRSPPPAVLGNSAGLDRRGYEHRLHGLLTFIEPLSASHGEHYPTPSAIASGQTQNHVRVYGCIEEHYSKAILLHRTRLYVFTVPLSVKAATPPVGVDERAVAATAAPAPPATRHNLPGM
jgi:hypothetical protein